MTRRLLTLQELMKEFEAQKLIQSIRCLLDNARFIALMKTEGISSRKTMTLQVVRKHVVSLLESCKDADLRMSMLAVNRLFILFDSPSLSEAAIAESLPDAVKRTILTIEDELSLRSYFALEPKEADFYMKPWNGWETIIARFGNTTRDIEEMNKSFAMNRYTASMFHALHVAEWGAIELGNYIGVTDPKKGWGPTEKKLKELIRAGHSQLPSNIAGKFEFLEQMGREIDTMVLAWRHKVDHAANHLAIVPNTEFTPDIAEHIISSVKVFMNRLVEGMP